VLLNEYYIRGVMKKFLAWPS